MAYRPILTIDVEFEGATFTFISPDVSMSRYDALISRHVSGMAAGRSLTAMSDEERAAFSLDCEDALRRAMPEELGAVLCDMFTEGVIDWTDVEGPEGGRLACNAGTKRRIPYDAKVAIANAYIGKSRAVEAGKVASPKPPTASIAEGAATANPSEATDTPAMASDAPTAQAP